MELPKSIQWTIRSFEPVDKDKIKKTMQPVFQQLKYKHAFSTEVIPLLLKGTRLVVCDEEGPCGNCYYYGDWDNLGSDGGFCANHANHKECDKVWLTFENYKKNSRLNYHFESYEEYALEKKMAIRKHNEMWDRLYAGY